MPFLDDTGIRTEEHHGPLLSAFAVLFDQIERMVVLNLAWAVQLIPAGLALAFTEWPAWVRVPLTAYSALAIAPATGALFGLVAQACNSALLSVDLARESLRRYARASLTTLMPLYSLFVWLFLLASWAAGRQWFVVDVLVRLAFLLLAVCAIYWGPLFAADPMQSAPHILRRSVQLVWRSPLLTVMTGFAILLGAVICLISIGGLFLIAPVWAALLQTQHYRHVTQRGK